MVDLDKLCREYFQKYEIDEKQKTAFDSIKSVYPFNKYEYVFSYFL